jgi:hypothetical protein
VKKIRRPLIDSNWYDMIWNQRPEEIELSQAGFNKTQKNFFEKEKNRKWEVHVAWLWWVKPWKITFKS